MEEYRDVIKISINDIAPKLPDEYKSCMFTALKEQLDATNDQRSWTSKLLASMKLKKSWHKKMMVETEGENDE